MSCLVQTRSDDQAHQLQRGDAEHAEHQMAHHLVCAAHLHAAPTVVVLDGSVDPLGSAAFGRGSKRANSR